MSHCGIDEICALSMFLGRKRNLAMYLGKTGKEKDNVRKT